VGKVVQPLQSVNYHDSRAHGHEQHGPFTRLVGVWLGRFGLGLVSLVHGMQQVQILCVCFGYRWDACERWSFLAIGVTPVSFRPLITVGNLGAWSCLDIVSV
jgi:hypothetical protein